MKINARRKTLFILILSLTATAFIMLSLFVGKAKAEEALSPKVYSPFTEAEYTSLSAPQDVYYCEDFTAVIEETNKFDIFTAEGSVNVGSLTFTTLKQVKGISDTKILILDNGIIKLLNIANAESPTLSELKDSGNNSITCNFFDTNGDYLVTAFGSPSGSIVVYDITDTDNIEKIYSFEGIDGDSPICINDEYIFYVSASNVYKTPILTINKQKVFDTVICKKMIANDDFIYYVSGNESVKSINLSNGQQKTLYTDEEFKKYDLGYVGSSKEISGLCFSKNGLLLAVSSLNCIEEFKIEDNGLKFTGYAIASGKTAYNRISKSAYDIEIQKGKLAVLDQNKLTVILNPEKTDYGKTNYCNLLFDGAFTPDLFALGENDVLLADKSDRKIKLIDYTANTTTFEHTFDGNSLVDVSYQNGVYYIVQVATGTGNDLTVFALNNGTLSTLFTASDKYGSNSITTVDTDGNVYISSNDKKDIYAFNKNGDGYSTPTAPLYSDTTPLLKLSTDFSGALFGITENSVIYFEDGEQEIDVDGTLKSFALSYDEKTVYFIKDNDERIYTLKDLPNLSLDSVKIPDNFVSSFTGLDTSSLKICSVNKGVLYKVSTNSNEEFFKYEGVYENKRNEYLTVSEISYSFGERTPLTLSVIIGYDEDNKLITLITESENLVNLTDKISEDSKKAYVATDVSLYFIPVITETDEFCYTEETKAVRIKKGTEISVSHKINFLDKDFYFAEISKDGATLKGYIPESFTTNKLYENTVIETISDKVEKQNKNSFRNAIIIILATFSVFGTSLFFILRKKN